MTYDEFLTALERHYPATFERHEMLLEDILTSLPWAKHGEFGQTISNNTALRPSQRFLLYFAAMGAIAKDVNACMVLIFNEEDGGTKAAPIVPFILVNEPNWYLCYWLANPERIVLPSSQWRVQTNNAQMLLHALRSLPLDNPYTARHSVIKHGEE